MLAGEPQESINSVPGTAGSAPRLVASAAHNRGAARPSLAALLLAEAKGLAKLLEAQRVVVELGVGIALVHKRQLQEGRAGQGAACESERTLPAKAACVARLSNGARRLTRKSKRSVWS